MQERCQVKCSTMSDSLYPWYSINWCGQQLHPVFGFASTFNYDLQHLLHLKHSIDLVLLQAPVTGSQHSTMLQRGECTSCFLEICQAANVTLTSIPPEMKSACAHAVVMPLMLRRRSAVLQGRTRNKTTRGAQHPGCYEKSNGIYPYPHPWFRGPSHGNAPPRGLSKLDEDVMIVEAGWDSMDYR